MAKKSWKLTAGTSFFDSTVTASLSDLIAKLGLPDYSDNSGKNKYNFEWVMETEKGDVFTIYNWKEYRPIEEDELITWHVGAYNREISDAAADEINDMLSSASAFNMTEWITKNNKKLF